MNIYEAAKKAGVSIATVSRVINNSPGVSEKTKKRVLAVLEDINYMPNAVARSLAVNKTKIIGVMTSDVRDSYFAEAIYTIEQEARNLGYNVMLCNTGVNINKKKTYLDILLSQKVEGIVLVGSVFKHKDYNEYIKQAAKSVPVVMLNGVLDYSNVYSIVCDDTLAVVSAVEYLYEKGHKNIAYFYDAESSSGLSKLAGFKRGLNYCDIPYNANSVIHVCPGFEGGLKGVEFLERCNKEYSAIITSEDIIAAGALSKLRSMGKSVPEDISIIGYNNSTICKCTHPALSSIDNKVIEIAKGAIEILSKILSGDKPKKINILSPELIIRKSC